MSLKNDVARVLESGVITGKIRVVGAGTAIVPADFVRTGELIREGKIAVKYSKGKSDEGAYDATANTFLLHNEDTLTRMARGLIIHEAVHAIHDRTKRVIRKLDDECAAYIAQGLYLVHAGVKSGQAFKVNPVLYAGMSVAEQMREEKTFIVSESMLKFLRTFVQKDAKYATDFQTIMTGYAGV